MARLRNLAIYLILGVWSLTRLAFAGTGGVAPKGNTVSPVTNNGATSVSERVLKTLQDIDINDNTGTVVRTENNYSNNDNLGCGGSAFDVAVQILWGGCHGNVVYSTGSLEWVVFNGWDYTGTSLTSSYSTTTYNIANGSSTANGVALLSRGSSSIQTAGGDTVAKIGADVNGSFQQTTHYFYNQERDTNNYSNNYIGNFTAFVDPVILDMSGSGLPDTVNHQWLPHPGFFKDHAVRFDITGKGDPVLTEWLGPQSGLLVVPNKDGTVTSIRNLFGDAFGFHDGFQELSVLRDKNNDGKLAGDELNGLYVWINKAGDGKVHPGELFSVQSLGITSISLNAHNEQSTFVRSGQTYKVWDWWPTADISPLLNKYKNQL